MAIAIKLDETNFFSWKAQTLTNLHGYELLQFVDTPMDDSDPFEVQQN